VRIAVAGELAGVDTVLDVGDLRRGEPDDVIVGPRTVIDVEVVNIPSARTEDEDAAGPCGWDRRRGRRHRRGPVNSV
jgi:hypothetical protein